MSKPLKYSIFLLVLGLVAGALLAFINSFTAPKIKELKEEEARAKLVELLPDYTFETVTSKFDNLKDSNNNSEILDIYYGINKSNKEIIVYKTSGYGYAGYIVSYVAIDIDTGDFVLISSIEADSETSGIGKKVLTYDFSKHYSNVNAYKYNDVLEEARNSILSGATFSLKGVLNSVDYAISYFVNTSDKIADLKVGE